MGAGGSALPRSDDGLDVFFGADSLTEPVEKVVVGTGFEPVKAKPAGLQPAPFDHFGILPAGDGGFGHRRGRLSNLR